MKINMGAFDRIIRSLVGIALLVLNIKGIITGSWAMAAISLSVVLLITSLFGFCPMYRLIGKK